MNDEKIIKQIKSLFQATKYSFLTPYYGLTILAVVFYVTPFLVNGHVGGTLDFLSAVFFTLVAVSSSIYLYKNYQKKLYLLDLYVNDKEKLIEELYTYKSKYDSSKLNREFNSISTYDQILMSLGEQIIPLRSTEMEFIKRIKQTYGLYTFTDIFVLGLPHAFVGFIVLLEGNPKFYQDGSFWFTYIGLILVFYIIYGFLKYTQKEGKYILNNYKYNKKEVIEYLIKKRDKKPSKNLDDSIALQNYNKLDLLIDLLNKIDNVGERLNQHE